MHSLPVKSGFSLAYRYRRLAESTAALSRTRVCQPQAATNQSTETGAGHINVNEYVFGLIPKKIAKKSREAHELKGENVNGMQSLESITGCSGFQKGM